MILRRALGAACLAAAVGLSCSQPPAQAPSSQPGPASGSLVLRHLTLIDGNGGTPIQDAAIIAQGGRITWVGRSADLRVPPGAAAEDLGGKHVIPGLIDLHTHVAESDGITQDPKRLFTRENVDASLRQYARYGVTTVVSMGTDQDLVYQIRDEQRRQQPAVARIFTAGRGFTIASGYPAQPGGIPGVPYEVRTRADAEADVNELAARHPDFVKIWVDDHFGELPKITTELSKAIIDAAHGHQLRVLAHVFYLKDAKALADAGIDGFVHNIRDTVVDDALIETMKTKGVWLVASTLAREASMFAYADVGPYLSDPFFTQAAPMPLLSLMKDPAYQRRVTSDPEFANYPRYLENAKRNLKRLADAGVRVGFGTDTGTPGRLAGFGDHWELQLMVEAGLTPLQALTAATRSAAAFLAAPNLGTIEVGKSADLVVLRADPLADIRNTREIDAVYIAGNKVH